jgi:hypothetical protein
MVGWLYEYYRPEGLDSSSEREEVDGIGFLEPGKRQFVNGKPK